MMGPESRKSSSPAGSTVFSKLMEATEADLGECYREELRCCILQRRQCRSWSRLSASLYMAGDISQSRCRGKMNCTTSSLLVSAKQFASSQSCLRQSPSQVEMNSRSRSCLFAGNKTRGLCRPSRMHMQVGLITFKTAAQPTSPALPFSPPHASFST